MSADIEEAVKWARQVIESREPIRHDIVLARCVIALAEENAALRTLESDAIGAVAAAADTCMRFPDPDGCWLADAVATGRVTLSIHQVRALRGFVKSARSARERRLLASTARDRSGRK